MPECPPHYNPADFIIEVCSRVDSEKLRSSGLFLTHAESSNDLKAMEASDHDVGASLIPPTSASMGLQLKLLLTREFRNLARDKVSFLVVTQSESLTDRTALLT